MNFIFYLIGKWFPFQQNDESNFCFQLLLILKMQDRTKNSYEILFVIYKNKEQNAGS